MSNPDRIYIPAAFMEQAQKDGAGTYYPNFTGDAAQFDLVAYVPESRVAEEREAAFKILCSDCAEGNEPRFSKEARWYYHELSGQEIGCSASKLRIAALEATEK